LCKAVAEGFAQKVFLESCRDAEERNSQQLGDFLGKAAHKIKKGQFNISGLEVDKGKVPQIWEVVLAA
jgi:hypothetical protein